LFNSAKNDEVSDSDSSMVDDSISVSAALLPSRVAVDDGIMLGMDRRMLAVRLVLDDDEVSMKGRLRCDEKAA